MDKKISNKIYIFSFGMALIIALYHFNVSRIVCLDVTYQSAFDEWAAVFWENIVNGLAGMALGYFFMSSAFLFYYNVTEQNLTAKRKRRVRSLIVPYLAWNVITLIINTIIEGKMPVYQGKRRLIEKWLLSPYDGPLWFIIALLLYVAVSPFIIKLRKYPKILWCMLGSFYLFAFIYCSFEYYKYFPMYDWWIERFVRYTPIYFTGAVIGLLKPEWVLESQLESKSKWIFVILLFGFFIIGQGSTSHAAWIIIESTPVLSWLAVSKEKFAGKVNESLKVSFLIFATHMLWFQLIHLICKSSIGNLQITISGIMSIFLHLLAVPVTYGFVWILYLFLKRVPKVYVILTGDR